jgi:hypothetical protein
MRGVHVLIKNACLSLQCLEKHSPSINLFAVEKRKIRLRRFEISNRLIEAGQFRQAQAETMKSLAEAALFWRQCFSEHWLSLSLSREL